MYQYVWAHSNALAENEQNINDLGKSGFHVVPGSMEYHSATVDGKAGRCRMFLMERKLDA